jgi:hypothetical protein
MTTGGPWADVIGNFDNPDSRQLAYQAANTFFERAGEGAGLLAASIAPLVKRLQTEEGQQIGLVLLAPYSASSAEIADFILEMSKSTNTNIQNTAVDVLTHSLDVPGFRRRTLELLSDADTNLRNKALSALPNINAADIDIPGSVTLYVIPDDDLREHAATILSELDLAIHKIRDQGDLGEQAIAVVDEVILPKLNELKSLLQSTASSVEQVTVGREQGIFGLNILQGSIQALAAGISVVGNVDEAAANVTTVASKLPGLAERLMDLLPR